MNINWGWVMFKELLQQLKDHVAYNCQENISRFSAITFIEKNESDIYRTNEIGHVTGSAWILSPDRKQVLLINHEKLKMWLPPGGHIELEDGSINDTALREAIEETGITDFEFISNKFFDIDAHVIPEHNGVPAHAHFDFCFLLQAKTYPPESDLEKYGIAWFELDDVNSEPFQKQSIKRLLEKTKTAI